ncbi:hypothetical protein G8759_15105 [Spirosoma aureum]|uniref:DMT family transporter n=1 Tax=Spirosoma aureum TaxID=2692134 RepID=A0A6G9ANE5_9BACT|nr:DMT family transporter [Spirosoma aureum]QIP13844.1 hypothetical protein G8759_15105 [Spirosoma aureum]
MNLLVFIVLGIAVGMLIPLIPVYTAVLNRFTGGLSNSAPIIFGIGLVLTIGLKVLLTREFIWPAQVVKAPWYSFMGGSILAIYLLLTPLLLPRLGVGLTISLIVFGQLLMAVLIDHVGLFGNDSFPLNWPRAGGLLLIAIGVWLLKK